jgi:hypothetical protein
VVHFEALSGQQDAQTAKPEPTTFVRQLSQPFAQKHHRPDLASDTKVRQFTRSTLGQSVPIHHITHSSSLHVRRQ